MTGTPRASGGLLATSAPRPDAGCRTETWIQVAIMLTIGGAVGAASFTHVRAVGADHGQGGWLVWADAVVLELMSVASGPAVVLTLAVQAVQADASAIGWVAAGLPALGFLVMMKIAFGVHLVPVAGGRGPVGPADGPGPVRGQGIALGTVRGSG